jgi:osmotically-inducible protein OsmY
MDGQGFLARWGERIRDWWIWLTDRTDAAAVVEERLRGKPYLALREVSCSCRAGVLTLGGRVNSEALRRIAEAVAWRVRGVECVANAIVVSALSAGRLAAAVSREQSSHPG